MLFSRDDMLFILKGKTPVKEPNVMKWAEWFQEADRIVARTKLDNGATVSTVFLGINHAFMGGPPILFETMVFEEGQLDTYQQRYQTWDQAEAGHLRMIERVKKRILSEDD